MEVVLWEPVILSDPLPQAITLHHAMSSRIHPITGVREVHIGIDIGTGDTVAG